MKSDKLHKIAFLGLFTLLAAVPVLQSCDDDEKQKAVDLRYRVEDSYLLPADGTTDELSVTFQVKSTDPWEIFGENKGDWYAISPATGDNPEKTYDVTIKCEENTSLDDRTEVINIKSDYWTGKKFTLTQKGTGYLEYEGVDMIEKNGNVPEVFSVLSNQKWTAKVTDGEEWLSISQGASGMENGTVELKATPNTGAMRYGVVTLYDRNGDKQQEVNITQDGVQIEPAQPENGKWYEVEAVGGKLTIHVVANSRWGVTKEIPSDETWYEFEQTEFNGSADLVINVAEYSTSSSVRNGTIILSSLSDEEGIEPVTTTIRIKQASSESSRTTVNEENREVSGDYYFGSQLMPGRYNIYIGPFNGNMNMFFMINATPWTEFRWHVAGGKSDLSTTPWSQKVFSGAAGTVKTLDTNADNKLGWNILQEENETGTWIRVEWYLNDEFIISTISDGTQDWKVPGNILVEKGGQIMVRCNDGTLPLRKWEYIEPLKWGE